MPVRHGDGLPDFRLRVQQRREVRGVFLQIGVDGHQLPFLGVAGHLVGAQARIEDHIRQGVGGKQQPQLLLPGGRRFKLEGDVGQLFHDAPHGQVVEIALGVGAGGGKRGQRQGSSTQG